MARLRQYTNGTVSLQGLDTHLEQQAQVLIIQQVVIFGQHLVGCMQCPYIFAKLVQLVEQLLHPLLEIIVPIYIVASFF